MSRVCCEGERGEKRDGGEKRSKAHRRGALPGVFLGYERAEKNESVTKFHLKHKVLRWIHLPPSGARRSLIALAASSTRMVVLRNS